MRILMVIGTRPEAIKMLPLALEMKKNGGIEVLICHSGQHEGLAREVFDFFGVEPDFSFSAMRQGQSLMELTTRLLNYFDVLIGKIKPHFVLVHGDTTTAFSASLAAFYQGVRVAHIEAGLRTFDMQNPFPEEFNRVAIDLTSHLFFAPTRRAAQNLRREGKKSVFTVGNTVIDALKYTLSSEYNSRFTEEANGRRILLITMHRRESSGEKMRSALLGIRDILEEREDVFAIFPAHPNPAVKGAAFEALGNVKNIKICEPMPLYDFHNVLSRCASVLTDSGGIQEEAAYLGVPIFLLRERTERPEALEGGNMRLLGVRRDAIREGFRSVFDDPDALKRMSVPSLTFGDGHASEKIVKKLLSFS